MNPLKLYDVIPNEGAIRERILTSFRNRQTLRIPESTEAIPIVPRDWQVSAAAELLSRHDLIVITATGSGKSLSYLLALITNPGKILLAIFPLLSLMTDQVGSASLCLVHSAFSRTLSNEMVEKVNAAKRVGIRACRITYSTMRDDPNLLRDIARGQYELVCASPEFVSPENKQFSFLANSGQFRSNLFRIVIDEAHLCYIW